MALLVGGAKGSFSVAVTSGFVPGGGSTGSYGYIQGSIGSISAQNFVFSQTAIVNLYCFEFTRINGTMGYTLYFVINGSFPQTLFSSLTVGGVTYPTSSSTGGMSGGATTWIWSAGNDPFSPVASQTTVTFI